MPPLSLLFKKASISTRLYMLSMFFLAVSVVPTQIANYQQRQQQQAMSAALAKKRAAVAKRNAAIAQLSSEIDATLKWVKQLDASGKRTATDSKRLTARLQQYRSRLKSICEQPQQ